MNRGKFLIPVLVGLMIGQLFADNERPFGLANTVRFGYSDNIYRNPEGKNSPFITDIVDLSFKAALSDRTDLLVKSQLVLLDDDANNGNQLYPNLYAMLNHNISPRLLLRLSDVYRSGEKSGQGIGSSANARYNYFDNTVTGSADYVLTEKDRLGASLSHEILRHDKELRDLDYTIIGSDLSWKRELSPQRTYATFSLSPRNINYDNYRVHSGSPVTTNGNVVTREHWEEQDNQAGVDQVDIMGSLSHTFNPNWQGNIGAGFSLIKNTRPDVTYSVTNTLYDTNGIPVASDSTNTVYKNDDSVRVAPLFGAGLVYSPSPRTRFSGDLSMRHQPSSRDQYNGQDAVELRFGVQHDLTAKLMAKATVRFANVVFDSQDRRDTTDPKQEKTEQTQKQMDVDFRLTYKLNRINFLEAGVMHREMNGDDFDWKENRVDVGWRVELN